MSGRRHRRRVAAPGACSTAAAGVTVPIAGLVCPDGDGGFFGFKYPPASLGLPAGARLIIAPGVPYGHWVDKALLAKMHDLLQEHVDRRPAGDEAAAQRDAAAAWARAWEAVCAAYPADGGPAV